MKKCPYCAEEVQDEAIKCKHCGSKIRKSKKKHAWILIMVAVIASVMVAIGIVLLIDLLNSRPEGIEWVRSTPAGIEFTKSEVTVAQYRACVKAGTCTRPMKIKLYADERCNWDDASRGTHPVNCVEWKQASTFCKWAGGRLPTEWEWFDEASNKGTRKYPWGNAKPTCRLAIFDDGRGSDACGRGESTWPVCSKKAGNSVSGLCDMIGNVLEWTSSIRKPDCKKCMVVKGGSLYSSHPSISDRSFNFAGTTTSHGFRCVRSMKPSR